MKVVVMWSGGKDSQACLIHSVKKYGAKNVIAIFCDTGWEHEVTLAHVNDVCKQMDIELITLKSDKQFEELCIHKHIFPTGTRRFCTVELKVKPFIDWLLSQDDSFIIVQGIRASESAKRAKFDVECDYFEEYHTGKATYRKSDVLEWAKTHDASVIRPIFEWSAQEVVDYILSNGQELNSLYKKGASRVGCYPCVYARLQEVKIVAKDEKYRDRLLRLERRVTDAMTKDGCVANFFQSGKIPERFCLTNANKSPTVREVFDYVTRYDDFPSLFEDDDESCMSVYHGLCE
ncbi:MAG: phosphoadenosine phosphosulfate reductase family protein [Bacteroidales bacterium]|uniref:phosphoadenosine phosphosulfate reductase family protein n=1 Tax=Porphyromonas sp. TaxID=1924944 RepID=UPI002978BFAA|nr:phosphoadenosine phosphosulfate reductase family protein [Porphyromonas sp.]MDD7438602.1 phosphoadenosine phosphosulfate reductase family protein [Bacteroidales bacterium]MDY3067858.1 phosphoadenosine phosphosulfate reductase family protein [Porphyromonas sp.]